MKDALQPKPSFDANDGEFWMCYRDFLKLGEFERSSKSGRPPKPPKSQVFNPKLVKNWIPRELPETMETKCQQGALSFHVISNVTFIVERHGLI